MKFHVLSGNLFLWHQIPSIFPLLRKFKFLFSQNLLKSAREPRKIKVIVEDEGSGSSEETMEEEDSPKLELLYQLFDDFIQLKRKLIDILSKLPLLIEMMDENNGEMNEQVCNRSKSNELVIKNLLPHTNIQKCSINVK